MSGFSKYEKNFIFQATIFSYFKFLQKKQRKSALNNKINSNKNYTFKMILKFFLSTPQIKNQIYNLTI